MACWYCRFSSRRPVTPDQHEDGLACPRLLALASFPLWAAGALSGRGRLERGEPRTAMQALVAAYGHSDGELRSQVLPEIVCGKRQRRQPGFGLGGPVDDAHFLDLALADY